MQIEAGKYYRTRDGRKVGPMRVPDPGVNTYALACEVEGKSRIFQSGGVHGGEYVPNIRGYDLMAEWVDGPVRTVTRKEIVMGTYGALTIRKVAKSAVNDGTRVLIEADWMGSDELKAAAAVLLELAGALACQD